MARILILYGSNLGQTAKIAERIASIARDRGHDVCLVDGRYVPKDFSLSGMDAVLVGASLHVGKHQRYIRRFAKRNRAALARIPNAFFSVCLSIASKLPEDRAGAERCVRSFVNETGWQPDQYAIIAGAQRYLEYGWLVRRIMKSIARREGAETDTSRNYEYTDWQQVARFAEDFLRRLEIRSQQDRSAAAAGAGQS